ncbi:MAG: hypothetical protein NUV85_04195, partial [Candidatus Berkelbacteria bacterium]|nr:hypothetical protein [Candidatus Berkelbacteria bacterium]
MTAQVEKAKTRLDGVYRQTKATVLSEYAYHPVRFFSIFFALVIGLGVLAYFAPIRAQIDKADNPDNTSQMKIPETTNIDSQFLSVAEVANRSSQPNEYFKGNYEVVPAEDTIKLEKSDTNTSQTEVKLVKEVGAEDRTDDISVSTSNDALTIESKDQGLTAGAYKVETIQKDTGKVLNDQKVLWGVLAFNPDYAIYPVGKDAFFSFAVLDDRGKMVCTAAVTVEVTDPTNKVTTLTTADGTVKVNKDCEVYGKTDNPDYQANFKPSVEGDYRVKIVAKAGEGSRTLHDQFSVKADQDFYLQRVGATRTYPPVSYQSHLLLEINKSGSYQLTESVPSSFEVTDTKSEFQISNLESNSSDQITNNSDNQNSLEIQNSEFKITDTDNSKKLTWSFDAKEGQTVDLSYTFKTPNISPFLFELGPAEVKSQIPNPKSQTSSNDQIIKNSDNQNSLEIQNSKIENSVWTESRQWLIASDNACQSVATGNWSDAANWTNCGFTVPQAADTVQILNTHTITQDVASVTVAGVTIDVGGTLTVSTTNAITVSGNWSNSGTFTAATGKTLSGTLNGTSAFHNVTFNTTDATATDDWEIQATMAVANDFIITTGNVDSNNNNLTVTRDFTIANAANTDFAAGSSTITVTRNFTETTENFI